MTLMSSISITVATQATAIVTTGLIRSRSVIGLLSVCAFVRAAGRTGRHLVIDVVGGHEPLREVVAAAAVVLALRPHSRVDVVAVVIPVPSWSRVRLPLTEADSSHRSAILSSMSGTRFARGEQMAHQTRRDLLA